MGAWEKLVDHYQIIANTHMRELLAADPSRASRYSATIQDLYINYARHRISADTLSLLFSLAEQFSLKQQIEDLFAGKPINTTEQRPALHTALRSDGSNAINVNGVNIRKQINDELLHMEEFVSKLHMGEIRGHTGKAINTLVNIGIGGADLGPRFVCDALQAYKTTDLNIHFVANIDYREINNVLSGSDPETTLFIISSKSFTTIETLTNAQTARDWLITNGCEDTGKHLIAVTANISAASDFGIAKENIFRIWDWVGGRYSVWSATGLPVAASIGMKNYRSLLVGANTMDEHFRTQPFATNIPVILGLLDIWYINYFHTETQAIIPYDQSLKILPEYLGQLMMESNGKITRNDNKTADYKTSPVIWGGVGTNSQHTFMQLLHQGTHLIPVDFIVGTNCADDQKIHHKLLLTNCLAQAEALMNGSSAQNDDHAHPYKKVYGNNPSTIIMYESLTPESLGMLLAMYEHRTFVQAVIWNINPFDQWGVELGKKISKNITTLLDDNSADTSLDTITRELIKHYRSPGKQK